jgi:hypothetical protein
MSPLRASRICFVLGLHCVQQPKTLASAFVTESQFLLFCFQSQDSPAKFTPLLMSQLGQLLDDFAHAHAAQVYGYLRQVATPATYNFCDK